MSFVIVFVLGLWLMLSICAQFYRSSPAGVIRRLDTFDVVPSWTFFAPNPISFDLALLVRHMRKGEQQWSAWRPVVQPECGSRAVRMIWNPNSRLTKILHDFAQEIFATKKNSAAENAIELSIPYLCLLSHSRSHVDLADVESFQFGLIEYLEEAPRAEIRGFVALSQAHKPG